MAQFVAYFTGFETGDGSELNLLAAGASIVTSPVCTGGYALKASTTLSRTHSTSALAATQSVFREKFQFPALPVSNTKIFQARFSTGGAGDYPGVSLTSSGSLRVQDASGTWGLTSTTGTAILSPNTWYRLELVLDCAAGGVVQLRVNGVLDLNLTHTNDVSASPINYWGLLGAANPNEYFHDDIRIDVGGVAAIGDGQCIARQGIAGTPTYDNATKNGGATAATCWSDTPFDTTNFTTETTNGEFQTMLVGSFATDPSRAVEGTQVIRAADTINAVKVGMVAKTSSTASDGENMSMRRRVGGGNTDTAKLLTTSDAYYETALFTDTVANLNSYEIGGGKTGAQASTITIRDMWLMVDYTPQSPGSAAGIGTATGVGLALSIGAGAAVGTGAAAGVGARIAASTAAAAGTGAAVGVGASIAAAVGAVVGAGAALGVGASTAASIAAAAGTGAAVGVGASTAASIAAAAGTGAAVGVGASIVAADGIAAGTGAAVGVGSTGLVLAVGTAAGAGDAVAVGASIAAAVGVSVGAVSALAVGSGTATGAGVATGTGFAIAVALPLVAAEGVVVGAGAAVGVGASTAAAVGIAVGTAAGTGVGGTLHIVSSIGFAAGSGAAAGVGVAFHPRLGTAGRVNSSSNMSDFVRSLQVASVRRAVQIVESRPSQVVSGRRVAQQAVEPRPVGLQRRLPRGYGLGAAAGVGTAAAVAAVIAAAVGVASGIGGVTAFGTVIVAAVGVASGVGSGLAIGTGAVAGVGVAVGAGAVTGIGTGVVAAMGVAVGAGSVSASSTLSNALSLGTDLLTLGGDQLTLGP